MYTLYILYSHQLDNFYIGHTGDMAGRIRKHLTNHSGFTARAKDWEVMYREEYPDKSSAYARERELKSWKSKPMIKALIANKI